MADCKHCKNCYYVGGFMECRKDLWSEILEEPCEEFTEYTQEDEYWEKYAQADARWANNDYGRTWSELE